MPNPPEDNKTVGRLGNRLPGSGVRRDLKDTWSNILAKAQPATERNNPDARYVAIERIAPNPDQPRRIFDPERDQELADDIKQRGILEPILVRPIGEDEQGTLYQIVAGERRYRAAKTARLELIPVMVHSYDDDQAKYISLVENLQRQDLDPRDEARYFNLLIETFNFSYKEIATKINRSASYVAGRMKLLNEPEGSGAVPSVANATRETLLDSEIPHIHAKSTRKLKKSQSGNTVVRPMVRFRTYLIRTKLQLPDLQAQDRQLIAEQIKELRQQLDELEQEL